MSLETKVTHIKESLNKMSQDEFNLMLKRNGYGKIKDVKDSTFYNAIYGKDKRGILVMEKLKLYTVTKGSTDGSVKVGHVVWISENGDLNIAQDKG